MELSYKEIRAQICDVCHKMWQLGWVASNDGNVSVKLSDGTFLATREFDTLKSKKVPQSLEIGLFFCQIFIFII